MAQGPRKIRADLKEKAAKFFLRPLVFPGPARALQRVAKKTEKGQKRPISRKGGQTNPTLGIVRKVFSEKVPAITRIRQKCFRNASKVRQEYTKIGLVLLGIRGTFQNPSKMSQKCV